MSCPNVGQCGPQDCELYSYDGESDSLRILSQFRENYENELHKIDSKGGGDCLQAKINLQEQWIKDLTAQNEIMTTTIGKLEREANERVKMLEAKLKSYDECIWEKEEALEKHKEELTSLREITDKKDEELQHLKRLEKINPFKSAIQGFLKMMAEGQTLLTIYQLNDKQDQIVNLRREIKITEERRLQNENKIELKDDIIKKLRKEIRQLKQQMNSQNEQFNENIPSSIESVTRSLEHGSLITINHLIAEEAQKSSATFVFQHENNKFKDNQNEVVKDEDEFQKLNHYGRNVNLNKRDAPDLSPRKSDSRKLDIIGETWQHCQSEGNLSQSDNFEESQIRPVKDRSVFTAANMRKDDDALSMCEKTINVPNHMPVKTFVNNIEEIQSENEKK